MKEPNVVAVQRVIYCPASEIHLSPYAKVYLHKATRPVLRVLFEEYLTDPRCLRGDTDELVRLVKELEIVES